MKESSKKRIYWTLIGILALLLLAGAAWMIYSCLAGQNKKPAGSNASVDADASAWDDGIDSGEQTGEITDNILVPGYSGAEMKAGDMTLNLRIGNPEENTCYLQATLQLEDGTVLFESGLLEPGTGFEQIELTQTLEAGTYEAWVHYQGYSMDEEQELLNGSDSAFTLTVTP